MRFVRSIGAAVLLVGASCGGGGGGGGGGGPTSLAYASPTALYRQGVLATPDAPIVGGPAATAFTVTPTLPAGLVLDPVTGVLSGTPAAPAFLATYTVTASNAAGQAQGSLAIQVTPPLPATFATLEPGFHVETLVSGLPTIPAKMAFAADGRLFFTELTTGNIRVFDALGGLVPTPVATVAVVTGVEQGLIGIALSPTFGSDGLLYVRASVNVGGPGGDRNQVIRYTVGANNLGTNPVVIVDDLPIGAGLNGGALAFGLDGMLYTTTGDCGTASDAQNGASLAGRVLRYTAAGAVPGDNPIGGSPEFCRGLRNTYGLCVHPVTGGLFGADNGPASDDELNFLRSGRNFDWPAPPGGASISGYRIQLWPEVIAPTGIAFYTAAAFGAAYANNLFVGGYVNADVRRLVLSGPAYTDLDAELPFAGLVNLGTGNQPVDLVVGPEGALYVATINAIYRIRRYP